LAAITSNCNEMQILTKICKKLESSLSFSSENAVTEGAYLRQVKTATMNVFFY